jgi:hypothetical protein
MKYAMGLFVASLALSAQPLPALAQEVGQYAVVVIPPQPSGDLFSHALIVDTKNGYVWEWINQGAIGSRPTYRGLVYQGKAVPGKDSGPDSH